MECADIGIENFHLIEEEAPPIKKVAVRTQHKMLDSDQKVFFDLFLDESDGTQANGALGIWAEKNDRSL